MRDHILTDKTATDSTVEQKAEWVRVPEAVRLYGISKTKFFMLAKEGKITSVSLREKGQTKATRLYHAPSIDAYIRSFLPENQQAS